MKIPRWAQVLIGVGIIAVFLGIGAIIAISAYFAQNMVVSSATSRDVDNEFEKVRERFKGQPPLLEMRDGVPHYVEARASAPPTEQTLQTLHVIAWDQHDEKLAKVNVPWWVVRFKSGSFRFSTYASGFDDEGVSLRPEDIEKHGPGIILEMTGRNGERVMLWAE